MITSYQALLSCACFALPTIVDKPEQASLKKKNYMNNQIFTKNHMLRAFIGGVTVVAIGIACFLAYTRYINSKGCLPTPLISEIEKFAVHEKIIGGPKELWTQAKDDKGKNIPNVYVFAPTKDTKNAAGYDMSIPEKAIMVAHVVDLKNKCSSNVYVAYGGQGAFIQGNYKVTTATLYANVEKFDDQKAGTWGIIDPKTNTATKLSFIGMQYKAPAPICEGKSIGSIAQGAGENIWVYSGNPKSFTLRKQDALVYFDGKETKTATGPATMDAIAAATIYCGK